jgi:PASTA domain
MARHFDITGPVGTVAVSGSTALRGEVAFTVKNATGRRLRVGARVRTAAPAQESWFRIVGEAERDLAVDAVEQYVVRIELPAGTAGGTSSFHLQVFSVAEPSEVYTDGPTTSLAVDTSTAPAPGPPHRRFPWWIPIAAAVVLILGGGVATWLLLRGPAEVAVPDVAGKRSAEAEKLLTDDKLTASFTEEPSTTVQPDQVIRHTPAAGQKVARGTAVTLVVAVAPRSVAVRSVVGQSRADAEREVASWGLTAKTTEEVSQTTAGQVIRQTPQPGSSVPPGTEVTLVVAKAPPPVGVTPFGELPAQRNPLYRQ